MMKALPILVALGTLMAIAQVDGRDYPYGAFGGYPQYHHASTAAEGAARGMADVVRSAGAANLMNSEAAGNYEDARSKNIDNRLRWTNTYFDMKRANKEYRDATKAPRPTSEQLFRLAKEAAPKSLNAAELDPVTGKIEWPLVLQEDSFASSRKSVDSLYAQRATSDGKLTLDQLQEAQRNLKDMQILLKRQIHDMAPQTFSKANGFLTRMVHQCRVAN